MRIYFNRDVVEGPWGGGVHFTRALRDRLLALNHGVAPTIMGADIVVCLGREPENHHPGLLDLVKLATGLKKPLIVRINDCDARKKTDEVDRLYLGCQPWIAGTVFVSEWMKNYYVDRNYTADHTVIVNGVDTEIFYPRPKLDNGKINIVTHHWSDNPLKGLDVYSAIDQLVTRQPDKFAFTYIGRHKGSFQHARVIPPLCGLPLGDALGSNDVYVSASRWDPGPNHVLEAIACELPILVHEQGGGAVDFAGPENACGYTRKFIERLTNKDYQVSQMKIESWDVVIDKFLDYCLKRYAKRKF